MKNSQFARAMCYPPTPSLDLTLEYLSNKKRKIFKLLM